MNQPPKFERKSSKDSSSSSSSLTKTRKKRPNPRNPLKDLNSTCVNTRISSESQREGRCLSFLVSNSSSSTPKSATPKISPLNSSVIPSKNPRKPSKFQAPNNSSKPKRRPNSKDPILGNGFVAKGKNSNPNLCFGINLEKNVCLDSNLGTGYVPEGENFNPNIIFEVELEKSKKVVSEMQSGSFIDSTPEKSLMVFRPEVPFRSKERERSLSKTPNSRNTPPIQASISPDIACGTNVVPMPICFAAGHVINGVRDKRKCRARGILAVGEGCEFPDESRISDMAPPVVEASMHWHSSPLENVSGSSSFKVDHGVWRFSPANSSISKSPKLEGLLGRESPGFKLTPSLGNCSRRTPTSNSSISPFSAIVRRTKESTLGFTVSKSCVERGGCRYETAMENTPLAGDSWNEASGTSTPLSCSESRKNGKLYSFNLDSMEEDFGSMRLSPKQEDSGLLPPLPALSFQFGTPSTPSNSIDLTCFKKASAEKSCAMNEPSCSKDKNLYDSELGISWREGLVSRIFEIGELDYCQYLSDDENSANHFVKEKVESMLYLKFDPTNKSLGLKEEGDDRMGGLGSFEFSCGDVGVQSIEAMLLPPGSNLCAESFSTDVGLISSGDSDWTLFYKNDLFEVSNGLLQSYRPIASGIRHPIEVSWSL